MKVFGSKELAVCLKKLGFTAKRQVGSSHIKYACPKQVPIGVRPFIIVILGRKMYDPHTAKSYVNQIKRLGFTEKEIEDAMR